MSPRAATFPPSASTLGRLADNSASACFASTSDTGFFSRALVKASMACTMASMPVAAVTSGGRPRVSSGSSTATSGSRRAETTPFFSSPRVVTMEMGVTSDPVPAVVGARISGKRCPCARPMP